MNIELEITQFSYWEHFKLAKDLSLVYPVDHIKRKTVEKILTDLSERMNILKKKENE